MAPIRSHTRTRTGCRTCRKRKVKCDESSFPKCLNCTNREIECDWASSLERSDSTEPPSSSSLFNISSSSASTSYLAVSTSIERKKDSCPLDHSMLPSSSYPVTLDMDALELLHQYTTETCSSILEENLHFGHHRSVHDIHQVLAPKLGLSYPFLMHSILALAAFHLHSDVRYSVPTKDYYSLSCYHSQLARRQDAVPICPDGTCSPHHRCTQTASALFLAKLFLSVHSFMYAVSSHDKQPSGLLGSLIDWMQEQRMIVVPFFHAHAIKLCAGPLAAMLPSKVTGSQGMNQAFDPLIPPSLLSLHITCAGAPDDSELSEPGVSDTYKAVVTNLEFSYRSFHEGPRMRALFMWASDLPADFIRLLREKRPRALILLAHVYSLYQDLAHQWSAESSSAPAPQLAQMVLQDILDEGMPYWWMRDVNDIVWVIRSEMPDELWRSFLDATLLERHELKGMESWFSLQHQPQYPSPPGSSQLQLCQPSGQGQLQQWEQDSSFQAPLHPLVMYAASAC